MPTTRLTHSDPREATVLAVSAVNAPRARVTAEAVLAVTWPPIECVLRDQVQCQIKRPGVTLEEENTHGAGATLGILAQDSELLGVEKVLVRVVAIRANAAFVREIVKVARRW